jgi:hypothetical protein
MNDTEKYFEKHKKSGIKIGDKVKVLRRAENNEEGWRNSWEKEMDNSIGKILKVTNDSEECGFELDDCMQNFEYPYFILEKKEE